MNPGLNSTEIIKCWTYNRRENSKKTKTKCDVGVTSCMASWRDLGNSNYYVTRQGCNSDKLKGCTKRLCKSDYNIEYNHYNSEGNTSNTNSYQLSHLNICCCKKNLCNGRPRLVSYNDNFKLNQLKVPVMQNQSTTPVSKTLQDHEQILLVIAFLVILAVIILFTFFRKGKFISKHCRGLFYSSELKTNHLQLDKLMVENDKNIQPSSIVEVDFTQPIGEGTFGSVYLAKSLVDNNECNELCFKVPKTCDNETYLNEIDIFNHLNEFKNINVVRYHGEIYITNKWGYLMEYCAKGSLRVFLENNSVDLKTFLSMAIDLSSGVSFLHNITRLDVNKANIAHRDICSSNLLVRNDLSLVVADFGVGLKLTEGQQIDKEVYKQGTPYYMAPEILCQSIDLHHTPTSLKQADVYSMGLVLWEICNMCSEFYVTTSNAPSRHRLPYQCEVPDIIDLYEYVVVKKNRPSFDFANNPTDADPYILFKTELVETISCCWEADEESRLTAACVEERFKQFKLANDNSVTK